MQRERPVSVTQHRIHIGQQALADWAWRWAVAVTSFNLRFNALVSSAVKQRHKRASSRDRPDSITGCQAKSAGTDLE